MRLLTIAMLFNLFQLAVFGGHDGVEAAAAAQSSPATVAQTLARLRANYPTPMTKAQAGALLNEVAWTHRADGWALLGKKSGNNCPIPGGALVSCDFLLNATTLRGWDALADSEGAGKPMKMDGAGDDMSAAIGGGARSVVLPVAPAGGGPAGGGPAEPPVVVPVEDLKPHIKALEDQVDALIGAVTALKSELAAQRDALNNFDKRLTDVVPATCSASLFGLPVSCRIN